MFYSKSVTSGGCCSENNYKYGQVSKILSLLMTTSTLILLLIIFCDIGKYQKDFVSEVGDKHESEDVTLALVKIFILLHFVIQVNYLNIKHRKSL